jgi:diketogulonate reductase-like aldo/keto reductase
MWRRRDFLHSIAALSVPVCAPALADSPPVGIITRTIPSSGRQISVVGMGSWLTFDCANDPHALAIRVEVLRHFFNLGGELIDSSPMYGTSQQTLGHCLAALEQPAELFSATKVWTRGKWLGERQMKKSARLWGLNTCDLLQVHNLVDADTHLETLAEWKATGQVRYIGATTSHGERHEKLEMLMGKGVVDFVQFTYNIIDREAEQRLLPMALERGIAVIVNRPFRRSLVFDRVRNLPLPSWAAEFGAQNWAQFFLKFIVSHRAVTCAIPATSRIDHMMQNMGAMTGELPDPRMRRRMAEYYGAL